MGRVTHVWHAKGERPRGRLQQERARAEQEARGVHDSLEHFRRDLRAGRFDMEFASSAQGGLDLIGKENGDGLGCQDRERLFAALQIAGRTADDDRQLHFVIVLSAGQGELDAFGRADDRAARLEEQALLVGCILREDFPDQCSRRCAIARASSTV